MHIREHELGLQTIFSEVEQSAFGLDRVLVGTPGSVRIRTNAGGVKFAVRTYLDASGARKEEYLSATRDGKFEEKALQRKQAIALAERMKSQVSILRSQRYQWVDRKTFDTLAVLFNHEIFKGGATLVGSHAFGALMNSLGYQVAAYKTYDIDIGRGDAIELGSAANENPVRWDDMLAESGIKLVQVPDLVRHAPATSLNEPGASRFKIDLLTPSHDDSFGIVPIPELGFHAASLPYFGYLMGDRVARVILGTHGAVPVYTPSPERFVVHKILVSQLRKNDASKSRKDLDQAQALMSALADRFPGAVEEAAAKLPISAVSPLHAGIKAIGRSGNHQIDAPVAEALEAMVRATAKPMRTSPRSSGRSR